MKTFFTSDYVSQDMSPVVDAYIHALMAKFPQARYPVGSDTGLMLTLQRLPEWISDWLVEILKAKMGYPVPAAGKGR